MLVYRDQNQELVVGPVLASLLEKTAGPLTSHEEARDLLVEFGELETGIADALYPSVDGYDALSARMRQAGRWCGHFFFHSWRGTNQGRTWLDKFHWALGELVNLPLPVTVRVGVPEGYAYYSLYPEMYLQAAEDFAEEARPACAVVVGIRSIGSSLSAVVAATLAEKGVAVEDFTVRPRGHPFDRQLALTPSLKEIWGNHADAHFLIVDEGPGLSGTSLTSAARVLTDLGIAPEQIVLLPSWAPNGSTFVSAEARAMWGKHRKYTVSFEKVWIESGRLTQGLRGALTDISGGDWRQLARGQSDHIPVQSQHERRKYLLQDDENGEIRMLKFAGLGKYGQRILDRAKRLAQAGWGPRPQELRDGFLMTDFIAGQPLRSRPDKKGLDTLARYLAWVTNTFPAAQPQPFETLAEMIRVNTAEALGATWQDRMEWLASYKGMVENAPASELDARMFPHEWLTTSFDWIKTDGWEHHDDHFFPGPQNAAWDVAGTCIEFNLDSDEQAYLVDKYAELARDPEIKQRFAFYTVAYLAYRLGYAAMAERALGHSTDGTRFREQVASYAHRLKYELGRIEKPHERKTFSRAGALQGL